MIGLHYLSGMWEMSWTLRVPGVNDKNVLGVLESLLISFKFELQRTGSCRRCCEKRYAMTKMNETGVIDKILHTGKIVVRAEQ